MKVAVILSGEVRNFDECYSSLESNILNYNDCNIFFHAYEEERVTEAVKLFNPKKTIIDLKDQNVSKISDDCFYNKPPETDPTAVFAMWKNIKKSFDIIEGNYDFVLKTRYDVKYCSPLKLNEFDPKSLWIPQGGDWRDGMFDMLCFSSYENMKHYCYLYDSLNRYSSLGVPCHSEIMLRHHMSSFSSMVNRFDYTILLRRKFDKPWAEDRVFTLR